MIIYGNNFHEKLFGIAISKDYIKKATPYCDIAEDPNFAVDIDLAVSFNQALNGDIDAAESFTNLLVLSSAYLDMSTIEFYKDKMIYLPIFREQIDRINFTFNNLNSLPKSSFTDALKNALMDCLNSPCNVFSPTSDSMGRAAQASSTKTADNSFGVGSLKDSFVNTLNGLDQTIFNKIPTVFQQGFVEVTQTAQQSWSNTQGILAGKKNLDELVSLANNGNSMRDTGKMYRYTPDAKSNFDLAAAGSNIMARLASTQGGCFDKFQQAYRYNPYEHNTSEPMKLQEYQYNGESHIGDAQGKYGAAGTTPSNISTLNTPRIENPTLPFISDSIILGPRGYSGIQATGLYSTFGGMIDRAEKVFVVDDLTAAQTGNSNDNLTMDGTVSVKVNICPSNMTKGYSSDKEAAMAGKSIGDGKTILSKYSEGYTHDVSVNGLEKIITTPKVFNDGVAISSGLWKVLTGHAFGGDGAWVKYANKNKVWVVLQKGNGQPKLVKIVDSQGGPTPLVDMTPGCYKYVFGHLPTGKETKDKTINDAGWRLYIGAHRNEGTLTARIAIGNLEDVKAKLGILATGVSITPGTITS